MLTLDQIEWLPPLASYPTPLDIQKGIAPLADQAVCDESPRAEPQPNRRRLNP